MASHLDCFFISNSILNAGRELTTHIFPLAGLDHFAICLQWLRLGAPSRRPFHFEKLWLGHPYFKDNVQKWWEEIEVPRGTLMFRFRHKKKLHKGYLKQWNSEVFGNIFQEKERLE